MIKTDFAQFNVAGSATDQFFNLFFSFLFVENGYAWKGIHKGRLKTRDDENYILNDDEIKKTQCGKYAKWLREYLPYCFVLSKLGMSCKVWISCDLYENIVLK